MNTKNRKGFTITELVIVIAVIAILVAVLVPTFGNVIANSRKSHDEQYVHQLNVALNSYTVSHGNVPPKDYYELMLALAEAGLCDASNPFLLATKLKQDDKFVLWYPDSNTLFLMDSGSESEYNITYSSAIGLGNGVRVIAKTGDGGTQLGYRLCSTGDSDGVAVAELYRKAYIEAGGDLNKFISSMGGATAIENYIKDKIKDSAWGNAIIGAITNQEQGYTHSESIANSLIEQAASATNISISVNTSAEAIADGTTQQEIRASLATLTNLANSTSTAEKLSNKKISLADSSTALEGVTVDMKDVQMTAIGNVYRKDYEKGNVNTESFSVDFCGLTIDNMTVAANELTSSGAEWQTESDCSYPGGAYVYTYGLFGTLNAGSGTITISNLNIENVNMDLDTQTDSINGNSVTIATDMAGVVAGYAQGNVVFENIHVSGLQTSGEKGIFKGFDGVAGLVGRIYAANGSTTSNPSRAIIRNCTVEDLSIQGQRRACGLFGYASNKNGILEITIENTTLKNVSVLCQRNDNYSGMYSGIIGDIQSAVQSVTINGLVLDNVSTDMQWRTSNSTYVHYYESSWTSYTDGKNAKLSDGVRYYKVAGATGNNWLLLWNGTDNVTLTSLTIKTAVNGSDIVEASIALSSVYKRSSAGVESALGA